MSVRYAWRRARAGRSVTSFFLHGIGKHSATVRRRRDMRWGWRIVTDTGDLLAQGVTVTRVEAKEAALHALTSSGIVPPLLDLRAREIEGSEDRRIGGTEGRAQSAETAPALLVSVFLNGSTERALSKRVHIENPHFSRQKTLVSNRIHFRIAFRRAAHLAIVRPAWRIHGR